MEDKPHGDIVAAMHHLVYNINLHGRVILCDSD